jgi:hypothetical protein
MSPRDPGAKPDGSAWTRTALPSAQPLLTGPDATEPSRTARTL